MMSASAESRHAAFGIGHWLRSRPQLGGFATVRFQQSAGGVRASNRLGQGSLRSHAEGRRIEEETGDRLKMPEHAASLTRCGLSNLSRKRPISRGVHLADRGAHQSRRWSPIAH